MKIDDFNSGIYYGDFFVVFCAISAPTAELQYIYAANTASEPFITRESSDDHGKMADFYCYFVLIESFSFEDRSSCMQFIFSIKCVYLS
jgi:hypothetical protein